MDELTQNLEDPFNYHVYLLRKQSKGIIDGYIKYMNENETLNEEQIYHLIFSADTDDLGRIFKGEIIDSDHCSGFVKVLEDKSDIYFSQNTWTSPLLMIRVWKIFDFPWKISINGELAPNQIIGFSSYPSRIFSGDDFYILSNDMAVQETTINNNNITNNLLYMKPQTISVCMRIMIANKLANNGKEWSYYFSKYGNGCYTNQYLILDYKEFTPKSDIKENTLWLVEEIPGRITGKDVS